MRRVSGPRPAAIRAFAALFTGQALLAYATALGDLDNIAAQLGGIASNRDLAIVLLSARLSIAAIPVALIWFRASRIARALASLFALAKLLGLVLTLLSPDALPGWWLAETGLSLLAVALLFTPAARAYFARQETRNADSGE